MNLVRAAQARLGQADRAAEWLAFVQRWLPIALASASALLFLLQPWSEQVDRDALIAIASIVGLVLSLGFTVTLLIAQHTAERHARVLYVEFRREQAWRRVLAWLAVGVAVIVAGALALPTVSTGWASLLLAMVLGLYAATQLPRLLDSLDPAELAKRVTDRTVERLEDIGRNPQGHEIEPALGPAAKDGLDTASGLALQGISNYDKDVVRAGFAGIRRIVVAYVEASPTRGWDTAQVIDPAFQHLGVATELCTGRSPVLLLPVAIEELTRLGEEAQRTLETDGAEVISGRLNSLFLKVVAQTMSNDQSAAPASATTGIGASALALIWAESPNMVADHIRTLGSIAIAAIRGEKLHVAGTAHVQLSRIARALTSMHPAHVMPPRLYEEACQALSDSVDEVVRRSSGPRGLMTDLTWHWVLAPWMEHNLARVVVAGLVADGRQTRSYRSDFAIGAMVLLRALVRLASEGSTSQQYATESAYMAAIGVMALGDEDKADDVVAEMWTTVVTHLQAPDRKRIHVTEMLSWLLLVGTYEAVSTRSTAATMRDAVLEALNRTSAVEDDFTRRRQARAWINAGRAALGAADGALASAIATTIAGDVGSRSGGRIAGDSDRLRGVAFMAGHSVEYLELPDTHSQPEVIAAFQALLLENRRDVAEDAGDESHLSKAPDSQGPYGTADERGAEGLSPT